jgi:hypothetical protein
MDTLDELEDFIVKQIRLLDEEWFIKKQSEFRSNKSYESSCDLIRIIVDSMSYNQEEIFDEEDQNYYPVKNIDEKILIQDVHEFNIEKYCGAYLPIDKSTQWGAFAFEDWYSNNFREVSFAIASKAREYVGGNQSNGLIEGIKNIYDIRSYIISIIIETIKDLIKDTANTEYKTTMDHFLISCNHELEDKIKIDNTLYNLFYHSEDKLEFKLQQEELVALLYVLNRAEVFNTLNYNDTSFLKFCSRYFQFQKKGIYQSPKSEKVFSEKYREILRDTSGKGVEKIVKRLTVTLKELT